MLQDPWFYATAVPAVLMFGLSKGGFGGAAGMLAVPFMALVLSPAQAAAVLLPVLLVMDAIGLWAYRRDVDHAALWVLVPGGLAGIVLASLVFDRLSDDVVRLVVGVIAIAFCLWHWLHREEAAAGRRAPPRAAGVFWGTVGGFTSTLAHAGGPPLNIYLLGLRLSPAGFVGTMVYVIAVVNAVKVPSYALLGLFTPETLTASLIMVPVAVLGMGLGIRLLRVIDRGVFYKVVYVLVFVTGLKLLWDGTTGTIG